MKCIVHVCSQCAGDHKMAQCTEGPGENRTQEAMGNESRKDIQEDE